MAKEQRISYRGAEIESDRIKGELIRKLRAKLEEKDKELATLKKDTEELLTELDDAYKELKVMQEELVLREKLSVAGILAAGVAHEIRNPLSIIGMSVQYLHEKFPPRDEKRKFTKAIMDKVDKLNSTVSSLVRFAQPHKPNFRKRDIHKVLDRMFRLVEYKCLAQGINVVKKYSSDLPRILIDEDLIEQIFLNLADNAIWAMPEGGDLIIATSILNNTNYIGIKVSDTGCGISKEDYTRIFNPFFSRREGGTGLGLSIVHRNIEEHRGSINVRSGPKGGASFTIKLPISQKEK